MNHQRKALGLGVAPIVLYFIGFAIFAAVIWRVDTNVRNISDLTAQLDTKADKSAVAAQESRAKAERNRQAAAQNTARSKKTKAKVKVLDRVVLGTPGAPGLAGESVRGPDGPVGAQGADGPRGEQGAATVGPIGPEGPFGVDGRDGKAGPKGEDGATGAQGPGPSDAQVEAVVAAFLFGHTLTCEPTADLLDPPNKQTCTVDP